MTADMKRRPKVEDLRPAPERDELAETMRALERATARRSYITQVSSIVGATITFVAMNYLGWLAVVWLAQIGQGAGIAGGVLFAQVLLGECVALAVALKQAVGLRRKAKGAE